MGDGWRVGEICITEMIRHRIQVFLLALQQGPLKTSFMQFHSHSILMMPYARRCLIKRVRELFSHKVAIRMQGLMGLVVFFTSNSGIQLEVMLQPQFRASSTQGFFHTRIMEPENNVANIVLILKCLTHYRPISLKCMLGMVLVFMVAVCKNRF
ncbi:hypothetical protein NC651_011994 [Populus alba x Populus x berolinensis]|nr:hypothetical protein NC651_011994 [Populus alba x Populus x berolinensis]